MLRDHSFPAGSGTQDMRVRLREGEGERLRLCLCVLALLFRGNSVDKRGKKLSEVMTFKSFQQSGEVTTDVWRMDGLYLKASV